MSPSQKLSFLTICARGFIMVFGILTRFIWPRDKSNCTFCEMVKKDDFQTQIVAEDSNYIMFRDIKPAAAEHYLVIPRVHVDDVHALNSNDTKLVQGLLHLGTTFFDEHQVPMEKRRFGFHIPPFNSVDHLHMHCFVLPFHQRALGWKYRISEGTGKRAKGWSWFIDASQAVRVLEGGGKIGIRPC